MAIYYAGQPLLLEDLQAEAKQWLDRYLQFEEANLFGCEPRFQYDDRTGARGPQMEFVGLPTPNYPDPPPAKLNTLYWPTGAVRWSRGVYLATESVKNAILDRVSARGQEQPDQLVISSAPVDESAVNSIRGGFSDPAHFTLSTEMYLLPPRPVSEVDTLNPQTEQLWLIPLVDTRYFWQYKHVGTFAPATWTDAYSSLATVLGFSSPTGDVSQDYLRPCQVEFTRHYANAAYLLDAVAHCVGHRVVRHINGSVFAQNSTAAEATLTQNLSGADYAPWKQVAGGAIVPERVSQSLTPEKAGIVPEKVLVAFRNAAGTGVQAVVEKSATSYGQSAYVTGLTKVFHDCMVYKEPEATKLANLIASDYYAWKAHLYDRSFVGVKNWDVCGFDDYAEWCIGRRRSDGTYDAHTRVQTVPYNFGVEEQLHAAQVVNSPSPSGSPSSSPSESPSPSDSPAPSPSPDGSPSPGVCPPGQSLIKVILAEPAPYFDPEICDWVFCTQEICATTIGEPDCGE